MNFLILNATPLQLLYSPYSREHGTGTHTALDAGGQVGLGDARSRTHHVWAAGAGWQGRDSPQVTWGHPPPITQHPEMVGKDGTSQRKGVSSCFW